MEYRSAERADDLLDALADDDVQGVAGVLQQLEQEEHITDSDRLTAYAAHKYAEDRYPGIAEHAASFLCEPVTTGKYHTKRGQTAVAASIGSLPLTVGAHHLLDLNEPATAGTILFGVCGGFYGGLQLYDTYRNRQTNPDGIHEPLLDQQRWYSQPVEELREYVYRNGWCDPYQDTR